MRGLSCTRLLRQEAPGYHAKQTETRRDCVQLASAQHNRTTLGRMLARNGTASLRPELLASIGRPPRPISLVSQGTIRMENLSHPNEIATGRTAE